MIDCLMPQNAAQRRYVFRMLVSAGFSILFSVAAALALRVGHVRGFTAYLLAILPAFPIIGALVVTGLYLAEEKDEFQRQLLVESLLGGMGITLAGTTVWGHLESFIHVSHLDSIWIYPIFWIATGISMPFVWKRYR
jgi:hypothetical protein